MTQPTLRYIDSTHLISSCFIFRLMINKTDLRSDDADEDSVTYERQFSFKFVETGNQKETDEITIVNPLLMVSKLN